MFNGLFLKIYFKIITDGITDKLIPLVYSKELENNYNKYQYYC